MDFDFKFNLLRDKFINLDVSNVEDVVLEFNITGDNGGLFYAKVKDGKLDIQPYNYYNADATISANFDTLMKIINKDINPVCAFFKGAIKIKGNINKALVLQNIIGSDK